MWVFSLNSFQLMIPMASGLDYQGGIEFLAQRLAAPVDHARAADQPRVEAGAAGATQMPR